MAVVVVDVLMYALIVMALIEEEAAANGDQQKQLFIDWYGNDGNGGESK